eukprot:TRINITY_DN3690_c0_g1_i1.p1 TRINITY_DN3690_c0_g1~~TRINITY_DN3690_c0_g1_i1.p1  ORF type:complete len:314 (+),score=16.59 TRINITY_DN3690_c0_g1_i1:451-1392(+)
MSFDGETQNLNSAHYHDEFVVSSHQDQSEFVVFSPTQNEELTKVLDIGLGREVGRRRTPKRFKTRLAIGIFGIVFVGSGIAGLAYVGYHINEWELLDLCRPCKNLFLSIVPIAILAIVLGLVSMCVPLNYGDRLRRSAKGNISRLYRILYFPLTCFSFRAQVIGYLMCSVSVVLSLIVVMSLLVFYGEEETTLDLGNDWYDLVNSNSAKICKMQKQFKCSGWGRCCNSGAPECAFDPGECIATCSTNTYTVPCQYKIDQVFHSYIETSVIICAVCVAVVAGASVLVGLQLLPHCCRCRGKCCPTDDHDDPNDS